MIIIARVINNTRHESKSGGESKFEEAKRSDGSHIFDEFISQNKY